MKSPSSAAEKWSIDKLEREDYLHRPGYIFRSFHASSICCISCIYLFHLIWLLLLVLLGDLIGLLLLLCRQHRISSRRFSLPSQCRHWETESSWPWGDGHPREAYLRHIFPASAFSSHLHTTNGY